MHMETSAQQIPIGFSLANCSGVRSEDVYKFIANRAQNCELYTLRPGGFQAAALDACLLLGAVGSVASIASLFWMAYDKFIAPTKRDDHDDAGIYVAVRKPDGTVIAVWLGKNVKSKDEFVKQFEVIVDTAKGNAELRSENERTTADLERSGSWVKVKPDEKSQG